MISFNVLDAKLETDLMPDTGRTRTGLYPYDQVNQGYARGKVQRVKGRIPARSYGIAQIAHVYLFVTKVTENLIPTGSSRIKGIVDKSGLQVRRSESDVRPKSGQQPWGHAGT